MGLQPGDITYPYVDPIWSDENITAPPGAEYVPPWDAAEPPAPPDGGEGGETPLP